MAVRTERLGELFGIEHQVAVVTGGAGGLGRAIGGALADAGATVVIADRDAEAGITAAEEIAATGGSATAIEVDVTDEASVMSLFEAAGPASILVNNVGWYPKFGFTETTVEQWDSVQQVNLRGTFLCMREAVKGMRAAGGGGRIVNISSLASLHPAVHENAAYAASKAGINGLVRSAALDLGPEGITVNAVLPGGMNTGRPGQLAGQKVTGPAVDRGWLLGRTGEAAEIAAVVLLLVGPSGGWITGQSIAVDGGFLVS